VDDIIAVLERSDRVVEIELSKVNGSNLEIVLAAMQVPFPELTDLQLTSEDGNLGLVSVLHDVFNPSFWKAFHFRVYRNFFCLPLTSSIFTF
jgi:hypothetical protein